MLIKAQYGHVSLHAVS